MDSEVQRLEHLKLVQAVIERMARNSFALKSWAVLLVSASLALGADRADYQFFMVGMLPVLMLWLLDGYYLWQERLYRALYNGVRRGAHGQHDADPYSLTTTAYRETEQTWTRICFSVTVGWFYGVLGLVVTVATGVTLVAQLS